MPQQPERSEAMVVIRKANNPGALPKVDKEKESKFQVTSDENYEKLKFPKYEWHLVLNNVSIDKLTRLARNPKLNISSLVVINSTRHDLTCRSCFESETQRTAHRPETHNYGSVEAFSSDILGPLNI